MSFSRLFGLVGIAAALATSPSLASAQTIDEIVQKQIELILEGPEKFEGFSAGQRSSLFKEAVTHPVAGPGVVGKYDPTGMIGFCFGRALCVDLIARQMGLAKKSLLKIFYVGDMRSNPEVPEWRFHVTTAVIGDDGSLYAVDPIMRGPMLASEWIRYVQKIWDPQGKGKVYFTPPLAIMPDTRVFRDLADEKGDRIIELKFDPAARKDEFRRIELDGLEVFAMKQEIMEKYFLHIHDNSPNRFNWEAITINKDHIPFNGYFPALAKDLRDNPRDGERFALKGPGALESLTQTLLFGARGLQPAKLPAAVLRSAVCDFILRQPGTRGLGSLNFGKLNGGSQ
jgi:hypothetical protein